MFWLENKIYSLPQYGHPPYLQTICLVVKRPKFRQILPLYFDNLDNTETQLDVQFFLPHKARVVLERTEASDDYTTRVEVSFKENCKWVVHLYSMLWLDELRGCIGKVVTDVVFFDWVLKVIFSQFALVFLYYMEGCCF